MVFALEPRAHQVKRGKGIPSRRHGIGVVKRKSRRAGTLTRHESEEVGF